MDQQHFLRIYYFSLIALQWFDKHPSLLLSIRDGSKLVIWIPKLLDVIVDVVPVLPSAPEGHCICLYNYEIWQL